MESNAFWSYGSKFKVGNGATPEVFSDVAEVKDITPPQYEREVHDVSHHGSDGGFKEYIAGWRDGGEVELLLNWLPTDGTHDDKTGLLADYHDNARHNYKIVLPDNLATIAFSGVITAYQPDMETAKGAELSVTIKVSGKPTISYT